MWRQEGIYLDDYNWQKKRKEREYEVKRNS